MKNIKKYLFSKKDILSLVARYGISQSPFYKPNKLEIVIDKLNNLLEPFFRKAESGHLQMDRITLSKFIDTQTKLIPEFRKWNKPKKAGWNGFTSRYDSPKPEYDYIDLDALTRNVTNDIISQND